MAKKRNIEDNVQNVFEKMQEAYRDIDEQKRKLMATIRSRRQMFTDVEQDVEDTVNLAKADTDNFKLLDNLIEKKIKLIQIHTKLVAPTIKTEKGEESKSNKMLDSNMIKELRAMAKENNKRDIEYNLNED